MPSRHQDIPVRQCNRAQATSFRTRHAPPDPRRASPSRGCASPFPYVVNPARGGGGAKGIGRCAQPYVAVSRIGGRDARERLDCWSGSAQPPEARGGREGALALCLARPRAAGLITCPGAARDGRATRRHGTPNATDNATCVRATTPTRCPPQSSGLHPPGRQAGRRSSTRSHRSLPAARGFSFSRPRAPRLTMSLITASPAR